MRIGRYHAHHSVVNGIYGIHEIVLYLFGQFGLWCLHVFHEEFYSAFDSLILVFKVSFPVCHEFLQSLNIFFRQCEHNHSLERYGVAHVSAVPCGKTSLAVGNGFAHEANHELVGIGATFVYFQSGVSATQSLECDTHCCVLRVGVHFLIAECGCNVDAAGATDHELAPALRVEVEKHVAVQFVGRKGIGSEHAGFLVGSDESLHWSVFQCLVFHYGHDGGHSNTIVGTKSSAFCLHPLAVDVSLDGVGLEVVCAFRRLLRHHIHVCLKNHSLLSLHARCCRLAHYNVVGRVLEGLYAHSCSEVKKELLNFLQMS